MNDLLLMERLSTCRLDQKRHRLAILESERVQKVLLGIIQRVEELLRATDCPCSLEAVRTFEVSPQDTSDYHRIGLELLGCRFFLYASSQVFQTRSELLHLIETVLKSRAEFEWPNVIIDHTEEKKTLSSTTGIRLTLRIRSHIQTTLFVQFDERALLRVKAYSEQLAVPLRRRKLLRRLQVPMRLTYQFEVKSLATLLAIKKGGSLALTKQEGISEGWSLCEEGEGSNQGKAIAMQAIRFCPKRKALVLRFTESQRKGKRKMEQLKKQLESTFENLGVSLSVELGVVRLNVLELIDLSPGSAVEFSVPLNDTVCLKAGDEIVAEARLVERDQRLMLQVTKVCNAQPSADATNLERQRLHFQDPEEEAVVTC